MVSLLHEIWEELDERGQWLPSCVLAGPQGDDARRWFGSTARRIHMFSAGSHFEAMTLYYQFLGLGAYTTEFPEDMEPYPEEWAIKLN